eukprot:CAMPEP_0202964760 /NCGR_PEP_ID=MMETSP1396-20130829/8860_1 /ASSEMBLY_ACC=CAM_ASM_000872 /TAXON_ID= /ORGANISM="Pseudokeronopsis sp., Strain Brazil" /LENGTH=115 /DNA_ID=CAMNT_0049687125 /DNA_START=258 /DNA_END=606 /DNA_ORIENTATION=+
MPAVKANNGVTNCNHFNDVEKADTLAITRGEYDGEWWGVDLEKTTNVKRVVVYGRTDDAPEQTHQYVIRVGDSPDPAQNAQCEASMMDPRPSLAIFPEDTSILFAGPQAIWPFAK